MAASAVTESLETEWKKSLSSAKLYNHIVLTMRHGIREA